MPISCTCWRSSLAELTEVRQIVALALLSLLTIIKVLIRSGNSTSEFSGFVTDGAALTYMTSKDNSRPSLDQFLTNRLHFLELPSLHLYTAVVSVISTVSVLDAMRLMSEDGVSSVAVLEEGSGRLLSAVSVTDIGKVRLMSSLLSSQGTEGQIGCFTDSE
jgi:CBS domain-containing protein